MSDRTNLGQFKRMTPWKCIPVQGTTDEFYVVLSSGHLIKIDAVDVPLAESRVWSSLKGRRGGVYASSRITGRKVLMHRLILGATEDQLVDHINRDARDNRRANLRICDLFGNAANSTKMLSRDGRKCTSDFKGVSYYKTYGKWTARCKDNSGKRWSGYFDTEQEAAKAYDAFAAKAFGKFACLNFPVADV